MKKTLLFLLLIFTISFSIFFYDINAMTEEPIQIYNGNYNIYNADFNVDSDSINLSFLYEDKDYDIVLSKVEYYISDSNDNVLILGLDIDNLRKFDDIYLVYSIVDLRSCTENASVLFVFYDKINNILINVNTIKNNLFLENIQKNYYNEDNIETINYINNILSNYYKIKEMCYYANKPMMLSSTDNTIIVNKVYDKYTDLYGIAKYEVPTTQLTDDNGYYIDDTIVNYIPREYFFISNTDIASGITEVEYAEYGEEYGFYIKTKLEGENQFGNYLSVFRVVFDYPTGYNDDSLGVDLSLQMQFIPLFNAAYLSLKEGYNGYINFIGDSLVTTIANPYMDYGFTEFKTINAIQNYNGINVGDENYNYQEDEGLCITKISYEILNKTYNHGKDETADNSFSESLFMSAVGLIPGPVGTFASLCSAAYTLLDNLIVSTGVSIDTSLNQTTYEHNYYDANYQAISNQCFIKNSTFCLGGSKEDYVNNNEINFNVNNYDIGRYNYLYSYKNKVGLIAQIDYAKATSYGNNSLLQESYFNFTTSLYSMYTGYELKKLSINDYNYISYPVQDFLYTDGYSSTISVDDSESSIIPLFFTTSGLKLINLNNTGSSSIKFVVRNQYGNEIYSAYQPTGFSNVVINLTENEKYFMQMLSTNGINTLTLTIAKGNINTLELGDNIQEIESYRMIAYELDISQSSVYMLKALGADTEIYIYLNEDLVAYNDYWYSYDEEMNEQIEDEAKIVMNFVKGKYYILVKSKSAYTKTITTNLS